jgi:hypothetical protein
MDYEHGHLDCMNGLPRKVGMSASYYYGYTDAERERDADAAEANGPIEMVEMFGRKIPTIETGVDEFANWHLY